jgi:hypothetical protein
LSFRRAAENNCQIGRELCVNRRTVSDWVRGRTRDHRPRLLPILPAYPYAYLIGLYLGDGYIAAHPRDVYRLRIFLDRAYPLIVAECHAAISLTMPVTNVIRHQDGRWNISVARRDAVAILDRHVGPKR